MPRMNLSGTSLNQFTIGLRTDKVYIRTNSGRIEVQHHTGEFFEVKPRLVDSVNSKTGTVVLSFSDVGAAASDHNHANDYEAKNSNIQTHIGTTAGNPHGVSHSQLSEISGNTAGYHLSAEDYVINTQYATTSQGGNLLSADFSAFNGKQAALGFTPMAGNAAITGATKTKITYDAKGLVTTGADATTADIADSTDKRYVTDAQKAAIGWQPLTPTTDFSITAASTSTITMNTNQTATIKVGDALRYKLSGTYRYGRVSAITASLLTIEGVALTTGAGALTELAWKRSGGVASWGPFVFGGDDSLNEVGKRYFAKTSLTATLFAVRGPIQGGLRFPLSGNWYLIAAEIATTQDDSAASTQPVLQITNAGSNCLTTAKTIPDNAMSTTEITINSAYALFTKGVVLEMSVVAASGGTPGGDSANLSVTFFFVQE